MMILYSNVCSWQGLSGRAEEDLYLIFENHLKHLGISVIRPIPFDQDYNIFSVSVLKDLSFEIIFGSLFRGPAF